MFKISSYKNKKKKTYLRLETRCVSSPVHPNDNGMYDFIVPIYRYSMSYIDVSIVFFKKNLRKKNSGSSRLSESWWSDVRTSMAGASTCHWLHRFYRKYGSSSTWTGCEGEGGGKEGKYGNDKLNNCCLFVVTKKFPTSQWWTCRFFLLFSIVYQVSF